MYWRKIYFQLKISLRKWYEKFHLNIRIRLPFSDFLIKNMPIFRLIWTFFWDLRQKTAMLIITDLMIHEPYLKFSSRKSRFNFLFSFIIEVWKRQFSNFKFIVQFKPFQKPNEIFFFSSDLLVDHSSIFFILLNFIKTRSWTLFYSKNWRQCGIIFSL